MVKSVVQQGLETCFLPKMTVSECCGVVLSTQYLVLFTEHHLSVSGCTFIDVLL